MTTSESRSSGPVTVTGPLTVSAANPRYFTAAAGDTAERQAVYLTGSHIWNNLHDGMGPGADCAETPERLDYDAYLDFLGRARPQLHPALALGAVQVPGRRGRLPPVHDARSRGPRTGPGSGHGRQAEVRPRPVRPGVLRPAPRPRRSPPGERGIYVAVMLFDGWGLHLSPAPDNVEGHPFHAANNVNGIGIGSIVDYQVLPLDPRVQALQEAYIRKVVDTVHDLPNVLWEVANESSGGGKLDPAFAEMLGQAEPAEWGDSTAWQYWVIDIVKRYEQADGLRPAPDRDDDAVPRRGADQGQRPAVRQPGGLDLARLRRRDLRRRRPPDGAGLPAVPLAARTRPPPTAARS